MRANRRTLFSAIEVTLPNGEKCIELDWHRDLYPVLEDLSPNGQITDKIIDIAEELTAALVADDQ